VLEQKRDGLVLVRVLSYRSSYKIGKSIEITVGQLMEFGFDCEMIRVQNGLFFEAISNRLVDFASREFDEATVRSQATPYTKIPSCRDNI
jgi:hypothetical protein